MYTTDIHALSLTDTRSPRLMSQDLEQYLKRLEPHQDELIEWELRGRLFLGYTEAVQFAGVLCVCVVVFTCACCV